MSDLGAFPPTTSLGLGARALNVTITAAEVSAGLPAPKAAAVLLGSSGASALLALFPHRLVAVLTFILGP
jgi:hypothetical protein